MGLSFEDTLAHTTSKVNRSSAPADLKITDLRYALTNVMGGTAIIRIDTNQGIYGLGEVRDGTDVRYALMLKSRILGMNRSEEHTSELQSLMRISYAVFCLKKKKKTNTKRRRK